MTLTQTMTLRPPYEKKTEVTVLESLPCGDEQLSFKLLIKFHEATQRLTCIFSNRIVQVGCSAVRGPDGSDQRSVVGSAAWGDRRREEKRRG